MPKIVLPDLNLANAERRLVIEALHTTGSIVDAAAALGVTRKHCKRLILKHHIEWPRAAGPREVAA